RGNFCFHAGAGIRGFHVTGVQTCALPICVDLARMSGALHGLRSRAAARPGAALLALALGGFTIGTTEFATMGILTNIADGLETRSEERRVGQAGRSGRPPDG